jgi:hypothetical protein
MHGSPPNGGSKLNLGISPANLLINQGVMATLQERRLGYHSRAGLEPGTSRFPTLRINHYAARGIWLQLTPARSELPGCRVGSSELPGWPGLRTHQRRNEVRVRWTRLARSESVGWPSRQLFGPPCPSSAIDSRVGCNPVSESSAGSPAEYRRRRRPTSRWIRGIKRRARDERGGGSAGGGPQRARV